MKNAHKKPIHLLTLPLQHGFFFLELFYYFRFCFLLLLVRIKIHLQWYGIFSDTESQHLRPIHNIDNIDNFLKIILGDSRTNWMNRKTLLRSKSQRNRRYLEFCLFLILIRHRVTQNLLDFGCSVNVYVPDSWNDVTLQSNIRTHTRASDARRHTQTVTYSSRNTDWEREREKARNEQCVRMRQNLPSIILPIG